MDKIQDLMQKDHERLDQLLLESKAAVEVQAWQQAAELFQRFRQGIVSSHMVIEEDLLFPAFEQWCKEEQSPLTALLRKGHQDLRVFFAEMAEALEQQDVEEFVELFGTVSIILHQHDSKEESELYPSLDKALPGQAPIIWQRLHAKE